MHFRNPTLLRWSVKLLRRLLAYREMFLFVDYIWFASFHKSQPSHSVMLWSLNLGIWNLSVPDLFDWFLKDIRLNAVMLSLSLSYCLMCPYNLGFVFFNLLPHFSWVWKGSSRSPSIVQTGREMDSGERLLVHISEKVFALWLNPWVSK